jgi:glucokinase
MGDGLRRLAVISFQAEGRQDTALSVVLGTGVGIGQPQVTKNETHDLTILKLN